MAAAAPEAPPIAAATSRRPHPSHPPHPPPFSYSLRRTSQATVQMATPMPSAYQEESHAWPAGNAHPPPRPRPALFLSSSSACRRSSAAATSPASARPRRSRRRRRPPPPGNRPRPPSATTTRTTTAPYRRHPRAPPGRRRPGRIASRPPTRSPVARPKFTGLIPEKKSSVETVGQVYHCLLLYYVDHATLDGRILLNGAWAALEPAGKGRFTPDDLAPLALTGDREADWTIFAARYAALVEKGKGVVDASTLARTAIAGMAEQPRRQPRLLHGAEILAQHRRPRNSAWNTSRRRASRWRWTRRPASLPLHRLHQLPGRQRGPAPGDLIDNVGGTAGRARADRIARSAT